MCGIVGFISTEDDIYAGEKQHFMHFALSLDSLRGRDSTGIISVSNAFDVRAQHSLMSGDKFVHSAHYRRGLVKSWAKVGHNRAATRGSIKLRNAHPFTFGDVTLVHNGTLTARGNDMETYDSALEVDSMQISLALSLSPPEDAKKVLSGIAGSFAIVWTDKRDNSVNMARNSDRPIHFTYNKRKDIMWYMSDGLHLKTINKSFGTNPAGGDVVYNMDRMKILKYSKGSIVPEVTTFDPFVRKYLPHHSTRNTQSNKSALYRAVEKWQPSGRETKKQGCGTTTRVADIRIMVNTTKRRLLTHHVQELEKEYELTPTDQLEFIPVVRYEQDNGKYTVLGDIVHREWGDAEFDAILYDVEEVQSSAYFKDSWTVIPVGLSRPHAEAEKKGMATIPSVLCQIHEFCYEEAEEDPKAPNHISVGSRWVEEKELQRLCDAGCISCGEQVRMDDTPDAAIVNDGRDILCEHCIFTLNNGVY